MGLVLVTIISIALLSSCTLLFDASPIYAQVKKINSQEDSKIIPTPTQLVYFVVAMALSFVAVLIIVGIGGQVLKKSIIGTESIVDNTGKPKVVQVYSKFRDIVNDEDYYPSLAIFQFLIWTVIILFVIISIFFIKMLNGVYLFDETTYNIPYNILILMGLSVTVPVASSYVSVVKYGKRTVSGAPPKQKPFGSMLAENGKPSLSRFQMFAWTWVSIIFYLVSFISQTYFTLYDVSTLKIPDVPGVFVILMGISQGAYVGGKIALKQLFEVTSVIPANAKANTPFDLTIVGSNFGTFGADKDVTVWLYTTPKDMNPIKLGTLRPETDNRIAINQISVPTKGVYIVRVEKDGDFTTNDAATITIS
ncbi:MAG TPA: hypothetical protein VJ599_00410 [Nitrososphaeraceae archaeon]|nr:hypothetical protein [Nitrososphaeraceae archaeon]